MYNSIKQVEDQHLCVSYIAVESGLIRLCDFLSKEIPDKFTNIEHKWKIIEFIYNVRRRQFANNVIAKIMSSRC